MGYVNKICLSATTDPNNERQYIPVTTHLIEPTLYFDTVYDSSENNYSLSNKGDFDPVNGVVIQIKINDTNSIETPTKLENHIIYWKINGNATDVMSLNTNTIYNLLYKEEENETGKWYLINNSVSCIGIDNTNDNEYPILLKHSSDTNNETNIVNFINDATNKITANPSTGTITAKQFSGAFTGTASTATQLANARSLWGNSFDGSADIDSTLILKNQDVTIDTSSNNGVTSSSKYQGVSFRDNNNVMYGECYNAADTNGTVRVYLNTKNTKTDGTTVSNQLGVGVKKDGTKYYSVSDAAAFRSAISAPSITGANASGTWDIDISGAANSALAVSRTNTTLNATKAKNNLSSDMNQNVIWMSDTNDTGVARVSVYAFADTDKKIGLRLQARNYNSSTSAWGSYGGISIWANNDGTFTYNVSSSANFRSAIGAGTSNLTIGTTSTTAAAGDHTHSYLPLSGGQINGNVYLIDNDLVKGTAPSETISTRFISFQDKNNDTATTTRAGLIGTWVTSAKVVSTRIYAYAWTKDSATNGYFAAGYNTADSVARTYTNCKVYGAVWNDYAEYRQGDIIEGGYCVTETPSGVMTKSTERLQPGCRVTSDTFGFAIGETKECKTPIAVSGRVLVYTARPREEFPLGAAVCSAPDGKVDLMTREEIKEYPERIIGTVSEIPNYEIWYGGNSGLPEEETPTPVMVNGRIWIYIK